MKKILSSAMILMMILCCATPCFAAKDTLHNEKLSASMNVEAKYLRIYQKEDGYTSIKGEDGKFSETTDSGLKVELEAEEEKLTLIVHEITAEDEAAAKWFQMHFLGAENIAPLEFFMADENGARHELKAGTEITLTGLKEGQYIVQVSADGHKDRIPEAVVNGSITFKTTEAGQYYVVVTPKIGGSGEGEGESQPGGEQGGVQEPETDKPETQKPETERPGHTTGEPDTGDHSHLWLWIGLMAASAVGVAVVAKKRKA